MYLADPIPVDTTLTAEQQKLILGGEVCMWAEQLNTETMDSRVWPRTMAVAERFWSPQGDRDVSDMYRRLLSTRSSWRMLGCGTSAVLRPCGAISCWSVTPRC